MRRKGDAEIIRNSVPKATMEECTSLHGECRQPKMAASGFQGCVEVNWGMVGLPDRRNSETIEIQNGKL